MRGVLSAQAGIHSLSLPRRMGPRIREDDKIVSPSSPEHFFLILIEQRITKEKDHSSFMVSFFPHAAAN